MLSVSPPDQLVVAPIAAVGTTLAGHCDKEMMPPQELHSKKSSEFHNAVCFNDSQ